MVYINELIDIPESELKFNFIRSSGPGGQNVNRVATAAQLRFDVEHTNILPDAIKTRLYKIAGKKIDQRGILTITARRYRTQNQNRQDAIERFAQLVRKATVADKQRIKSKPTLTSVEKRIKTKKIRGRLKKLRKDPLSAKDE